MWKKYSDREGNRSRFRGGRGRRTNYRDDDEMDSFFDANDSDSESEMDMERPKTAAELSKELQAQGLTHQVYAIGGIKIHFPAKPYPSQFSMMDKIIKSLDRSQNSLLESPTGSGKSLALLCSSIAWQQAQKVKIAEDQSPNDCCCRCHRIPMEDDTMDDGYAGVDPELKGSVAETVGEPNEPPVPTKSIDEMMAEEDDDFKMPSKKIPKNALPSPAPKGRPHIVVEYDHGGSSAATSTPFPQSTNSDTYLDTSSCNCQCDQMKTPIKVPKIYFGTRTHKQIAQIARELAKTTYRDVKMTILASREHTCIDPHVSKQPKKNDGCKDKREGPGCKFYNNVKKVTYSNLRANNLDLAWDLEDFVKWNRRHESCPYYGARQLKEDADVIFCPYNYLIDSKIRSSMEINLKGQILILDEGHNIEDSARESASFSATQQELSDSMTDLDKLMQIDNNKFSEATLLKNMLMSINDIIEDFKGALGSDSYDQANKHAFQHVAEDDPDKAFAYKLPAACLTLFEGFFIVLEYIYRNEMQYVEDFRVALVRTFAYVKVEGEWKGKHRRPSYQQSYQYSLHFWCLNPAVSFSDLKDVKSIILTSGTLSPMTSFQSELGQEFPIQLEANHVINNKQVWVGAVSKGPRGGNLLGSYQHTETYQYQDELGLLIQEVCTVVPHGVLCFVSSYKMIDKLVSRWQTTGLYEEIGRHKKILQEPRGSDKDKVDFTQLLRQFYSIIKCTEHADRSSGEITGALFLAVCRGKVSEGMDFADNNARAVITVGIPFPNVMDTQIGLKRRYNNEHSSSRGLLTGSDWYEIQAYRALNQALGRCIRHRYDWGALILVDERFGKNPTKYTKGLSKWVRQKVQFYGHFTQCQRSLQEFTERMVSSPPGPAADSSMSASQMELSASVLPVPCTPKVDGAPSTSSTAAVHNQAPRDQKQVLQSQTFLVNPALDANTQNPNTTHYLLKSQDGGFIVSQNPTQDPSQVQMIVVTTPGPAPSSTPGVSQVTYTQVADQTIVAGPGSTQHMALNDTIVFKPPLASTQATPKRSMTDSTNTQRTQLDPNLTFNPQSASTQIDAFAAIDDIKTGFQTPCTQPTKKQTLKKAKKDDDPLYEPSPSSSKQINSLKLRSSRRKSRDIDNTLPDLDTEDFTIDERSKSPELFDKEDDMTADFTAADFESDMFDVEIKEDNKVGIDVEATKQVKARSNRKPLFDSNISHNQGDSKDVTIIGSVANSPSGRENSPANKSRSRRSLRGRLSRRKSVDGDTSLFECHNEDSVSLPTKSVKKKTKGVVYEDPDEEMKDKVDECGDNEIKTSGNKRSDELNKKRSTRNKRRRLSSGDTSNVSINDILDTMGNAKILRVSCKACTKSFTAEPRGLTEEQLPSYIRSALPSSYSVASDSSLVGDASCLDLNACKPISASSTHGLQLNAIWCDEGRCTLQFYCCGSSRCKSKTVSAVIERFVEEGVDGTFKSRVWFLPKQCQAT